MFQRDLVDCKLPDQTEVQMRTDMYKPWYCCSEKSLVFKSQFIRFRGLWSCSSLIS